MKEGGLDLTVVPFMNKKTESSNNESFVSSKQTVVRYRECMKNHAASIGGHANDGCGDYMPLIPPGGGGGTVGNEDLSLKCAACGCHRNFHRKEFSGPVGCSSSEVYHNQLLHIPPPPLPLTLPSPQPVSLFYNAGGVGPTSYKKNSVSSISVSPSFSTPGKSPAPVISQNQFYQRFGAVDLRTQQNESNQDRRSETPDDQMREEVGGGGGGGGSSVKSKRFRTKFTQEQKEKMMEFAERLGWRIQKHDDVALNQFCLENGLKRNVLKVWMHNNKNTLRKRDQHTSNVEVATTMGGAGLVVTSSSPSSSASPSSSPPQNNNEDVF